MAAGKRLVWSAPARQDLEEIYKFLWARASPTVVDGRLQDIERAARRLTEWPLTGRRRQDLRPELRSWAVPPHVIFYQVGEATIEIVRVIDGRRDIDAIFNPL